MQKQEYLRHFRGVNYDKEKILPHISEEFIFKKRNEMMINRILNPKRDKLIQRSVQSAFTSSKYSLKKQNDSYQKKNSNHVQKDSSNFFYQKTSNLFNKFNRTFNNSKIRQQSPPAKKFGVIYNQIQQESVNGSQKQSSRQKNIKKSVTRYSFRCKNRQNMSKQKINIFKNLLNENFYPYGKGPTILAIKKFKIQTNPELKLDSLIILQLVQKCAIPRFQQQQTLRTSPLTLSKLMQKGVKFAIKISEIGDFIPLRIFKCLGVNCVEIGRLDIQLDTYRTKQFTENCQLETQKKGQYMFRDVLTQVFNTSQDIRAQISFQCKIYRKRFQKKE